MKFRIGYSKMYISFIQEFCGSSWIFKNELTVTIDFIPGNQAGCGDVTGRLQCVLVGLKGI
jgi:hypothetical protein